MNEFSNRLISPRKLNDSYDSIELNLTNSGKKHDVSLSEALAGFQKLRISALTKAAEISPHVKEVTIGPNSPIKKDTFKEEPSNTDHNKENESEENLLADKVSVEQRQTLIMKSHEAQLQESSDELFRNLIDRMLSNRAETMRKYWAKQSEEYERKTREVRARKLQLLKDLHENDNVTVLEKAKLDQQNTKLINTQAIDNMNRILEEQNRAAARYAAVTDSHTKICICYNEITNLLQTDPLPKKLSEKYITPINKIISSINNIMTMCQSGTLSDKDVEEAESLSLKLIKKKNNIIEEIEAIKQYKILKMKEEEELAKQKELETKKAQEAKAAELAEAEKVIAEQRKKSGPLFYAPENFTYFKELQKYLENYEAKYKDLLENVNLKKFRFDCQKAVNTPVNTLSSVSGMHIKDKFEKLSKLLRGERVQVLDIYVTATQHPQGLYYCTALLAKKIVRQGDLLVSSNTEAAFPLAALAVALWSQFPEFGKLLEAYFHKFCPYLVPMFLPQKEGQTDKEFYMSRGYTYNEDGDVEKQDKFLKRMSGIFRLRCAIWIATTPRFLNTQNPHGVRYGWQWLASFINLKPEPDICATLIHDFFDVCGSEFLKCYRTQFLKIMKLISTEYLAILQNIDEGGPKTRLEVFLQNVLKTKHIPPPSGLLAPNIW